MQRLFQRGKGKFADLDVAAFALEAEVARREIAAGDLVHCLAIHIQHDVAAFAEDHVGVPFAGGMFILRAFLREGDRLFARVMPV